MSRLRWATTRNVSIPGYSIPCSESLFAEVDQGAIRRDSKSRLFLKSLLWPALKLRSDLLIDGFIESIVGGWISEYVTSDTTFLEVGCGDMSLRRFLPASVCYNAFDISLSEFSIRRVLRENPQANIALASATDVPLESGTVSLVVSTECFEHIPEIDRAIAELLRVAAPGMHLLCSIPNNYCHKYRRKGPHSQHVNSWTYDGFIDYMSSRGFSLVKGRKVGWWVPLPLWLTHASYQLPISSKDEFYNTNFFYVLTAIN